MWMYNLLLNVNGLNTTYNISLLDFGSQLAGLHIHSTYTHTITRKEKNTIMQIGNRVESLKFI